MARGERFEALLQEAGQALRAVDGSAFLVSPRIVKRVIQQDRELPGINFFTPHRKSYWLSQERLAWLVARDELGLEPHEPWPAIAILIARPDEPELAQLEKPELLRDVWRLLFHARVHVAFERRQREGGLSPADIRRRIDRIGQAEFDEIAAVIRQENLLLPPGKPEDVYVEFAALYLELRHFAPHWLPTYFPSLDEFGRIDKILAEDVNGDALFAATRLAGAAEPAPPQPPESVRPEAPRLVPGDSPLQERLADRLIARAARASAAGNSVKAALLHLAAARHAGPELAAWSRQAAFEALAQLIVRLQQALQFDDVDAALWRNCLGGLLVNSTAGFWNPDKRLLFDLQNVCVAHEREVSDVDLWGWLVSLGRRPLRRPLPNQREVLMSKHLKTAAGRLGTVRLSGEDQDRLSRLLRTAAKSAEHQMRLRLRPLVTQALDEVGLEAQNVPERVARRKVIEELLDGVGRRGFLNMGDIRDTLSRNQLKLPDLSGPWEFWNGDPVMRANRRLTQLLDGVYQPADFYLRWLQAGSSLVFGTVIGRVLTKYVVLPFGGAYVVLEFLVHLLHLVDHNIVNFMPDHFELFGKRGEWFGSTGSYLVLALGSFFFGLMHSPVFRRFCWELCKGLRQIVQNIVYDIPRFIVQWTFLVEILLSFPVQVLRRWVLGPAFLTVLFAYVLPALDFYDPIPRWGQAGLFVGLLILLNTRLSRNIEEALFEGIERAWQRFRVRVLIALYEVIVENFRWLLEMLERVMYAVDEFLRFKSGETFATLLLKGVLGLFWACIAFVIRFCVTLLIEPQINPIKHFPVVTVSHKFILPMQPFLGSLLKPALGRVWAEVTAIAIVTTLPGVFGFLVWELKENWRLFASNRNPNLEPVLVGDHGESLIRLMKPGFHSGTLPKLFGKLRRAERLADPVKRERQRNKFGERLHHLDEALRHFTERELLALLSEIPAWGDAALRVGAIAIASNSLRIELLHAEAPDAGIWVTFQEQSGWLVASIDNRGWLDRLDPPRREALRLALAGWYKLGGVDLIREQIEACFAPRTLPYDVSERWLILWPDGHYAAELKYDLHVRPTIRPTPRKLARDFEFPELEAAQLIFNQQPIAWSAWTVVWHGVDAGPPSAETPPPAPRLLPDELRLLPHAEAVPIADRG